LAFEPGITIDQGIHRYLIWSREVVERSKAS
jgi:hypothetical protein